MTALLQVNGLVKRFGGLTATDGVDLTVTKGEVHAVIGPNGAGKTTLINQLSGELAPDAGTIVFAGRDVTAEPVYRRALAGIGRSYQITSVFPEFDVLTNVRLAVQAHAGHSFSFWRAVADERDLTVRAEEALAQAGLVAKAATPVAALAHGERRQLEMAMTLATRPELLLLDEPMAGMSLAESERLVTLLSGIKRQYGILLVEHDMDAVFKLADRISVLVYGRVIACGDPAAIRANAEVRAAYLGDQDMVA
jgi:branched-chain amino acid transport system ATP-binding protein